MDLADIDAGWLYDQEMAFRRHFGQRFDVAGLARLANHEWPRLPLGNAALVAPGEALVPHQLQELAAIQKHEGGIPTIEIVGERDLRDDLVEQSGWKLSPLSPQSLVVGEIDRESLPSLPKSHLDTTVPPAIELDRRDWFDAVQEMHGRELTHAQRAHIMCEALIAEARFYAVVIGDAYITGIARVDGPGVSRFVSLFTDPSFRHTGFAFSVGLRGATECPNDRIYFLSDKGEMAARALASRFGKVRALENVVRRYHLPGDGP